MNFASSGSFGRVSRMKARRKTRLGRVAVAAFELLFGVACAFAAEGDEFWDGKFGSPGINGYGAGAFAIIENAVFLGGSFTTIDGVAATNIAKWDGKTWVPLGPGLGTGIVDGPVALTYCQGWLYAGGTFTNAGPLPVLNVARWDGTNWSAQGSGISGVVTALATDGSNLFVGGSFT